MSRRGWPETAAAARERLVRHPWLAAVPLGSVAAGYALSVLGLRGPSASAVYYGTACAASAAFAEAWQAAEGGFDADRCFETVILFLIPAPLFLAAAYFSSMLLYSGPVLAHPDRIQAAAYAYAYGTKAVNMLCVMAAALAVPGLAKTEGGALSAIGGGVRVLLRSPGAVLALLVASALAEAAIGYAWTAWRAAAYEAAPGLVTSLAAGKAFLVTAVAMFLGVALPLEARLAGPLRDR